MEDTIGDSVDCSSTPQSARPGMGHNSKRRVHLAVPPIRALTNANHQSDVGY